MGNVFTHEMKPLEVEILVAEVGPGVGEDELFHILYDGTVVDEDRFSALGGEADAITARFAATYQNGWPINDALGRFSTGPGRERTPARGGRAGGGGAGPVQRPARLPPDPRG